MSGDDAVRPQVTLALPATSIQERRSARQKGRKRMPSRLFAVFSAVLVAGAARAQFDTESLKKAAKSAGKNAAGQTEEKARGAAKKAGSAQLEKQINEKLLDESRKN